MAQPEPSQAKPLSLQPEQVLTAQRAAVEGARVEGARSVFDRLKTAMKALALYRHNHERYDEYLEPFYAGLTDYLGAHPRLQLRLDAVSYKVHGATVFEDESRDANLVFPLWQAGVRLLVFKAGITADELRRFFVVSLGGDARFAKDEDIITALWKAELTHIEYVVVEGFKALPDDDIEEVEVEVEKVVAYLYRQLQRNSEDTLRFARDSSADGEPHDVDPVRRLVVQGTTASPSDRRRIQASLVREDATLLQKMAVILLQVLERATTDASLEDTAEAFVKLLDALLLQQSFMAIDEIRQRFVRSAGCATTSPATHARIERCAERFDERMAEGQRLQIIAHILNTRATGDLEGMKRYFAALGEEAIVPLLEMLERLELPADRRLVCDVLVRIGAGRIESFTNRLTHPAPDLVKDMLYVIDQLDPPGKLKLFTPVLHHPDALLRIETLTTIGRNPTPSCFDDLVTVLHTHTDSEMRAQAARFMPQHDPDVATRILLEVVAKESFDKVPDAEKKAVIGALALCGSAGADAFVKAVFEQKSGLFAKKRVDDLKLLVIECMEAAPSVAGLQMLADVAKDKAKHSKAVTESARTVAITMKQKLLGTGG